MQNINGKTTMDGTSSPYVEMYERMKNILETPKFKLVLDYNVSLANIEHIAVHGSPNDKLSFDQAINWYGEFIYILFDEPQVIDIRSDNEQSDNEQRVRDDLRRNGIEWVGEAIVTNADYFWPYCWLDETNNTIVHYIPANLFTYEIRKAFPDTETDFRDLFEEALKKVDRPIITRLRLNSLQNEPKDCCVVSIKNERGDELFAIVEEDIEEILRKQHAQIADILGHRRFMISTFKGTFVPGIAMDQYDKDKKILVDNSFNLDGETVFIKFFDSQVKEDVDGEIHAEMRKNNIVWVGKAISYAKNIALCPIPYWPEDWKYFVQAPNGRPNEFNEYEIHYIPLGFCNDEIRNGVKRVLPDKIRELVSKAVQKYSISKPTFTKAYLSYKDKSKNTTDVNFDQFMSSVTVNIKLDELWLSAVVDQTHS